MSPICPLVEAEGDGSIADAAARDSATPRLILQAFNAGSSRLCSANGKSESKKQNEGEKQVNDIELTQ
jgi:hypothetical protein